MLGANSNQFSTIAQTSYIGMAALNGSTDWTTFIGGSYDDAQVFTAADEGNRSLNFLHTYFRSGSSSLCGRLPITKLLKARIPLHGM